MDLIRCNGEVLSQGIGLMGQSAFAELVESGNKQGFFKKSMANFQRLFHAFGLKPIPIQIETAKGKSVKTAIVGVYLLDMAKTSAFTKLFDQSVSLKDGRISLMLFAPQSILGYIQSALPLMPVTQKKLVKNLGFVRSTSVRLVTHQDTAYWVENKIVMTRELCVENVPGAINASVGEKFRELKLQTDDKENFSVEWLPQDDARLKYFGKTLPFFQHALESDFKDLFLTLKDNAKTTSTYLLLMVLSSLLATLGMFLNSPSVVIGAMVLAPLMSPIISLSMGLLRSEKNLTQQSVMTLLIGIAVALSLSAAMGALLPFKELTQEIEGRLHPTTLDLLVAIFSGIAGAFAHARESIAKSLPGIAIAVALVPPLCVAGIGIGWWSSDVFLGAMLLFLTNLIGITMAAALSFMVVGFAPFSRARKGLLLSIFLVGLVSVPLFFSFQKMAHIASIRQQLSGQTYMIDGQVVELRNIKVHHVDPLNLSADLLTNKMPNENVFAQLEQRLVAELDKPTRFSFAVHIVRWPLAPKP